jgi:creatinine amidohydrolase
MGTDLINVRYATFQATKQEYAIVARNGCKKVVIVSGHGGDTNLIAFFAQTTLETPKDYVVYAITNTPGQAAQMPVAARPSKPGVDGHAGEVEIASIKAARPELAHPERAGTQSGADQKRLDLPANVYTGIWWYARFPNHYQGNAAGARAERGAALSRRGPMPLPAPFGPSSPIR